jgi:hypothetical protein
LEKIKGTAVLSLHRTFRKTSEYSKVSPTPLIRRSSLAWLGDAFGVLRKLLTTIRGCLSSDLRPLSTCFRYIKEADRPNVPIDSHTYSRLQTVKIRKLAYA